MDHKKVFVITIVSTNSKSDAGIQIMETCLRTIIGALSQMRKCYFAFMSEVTGPDMREIEGIEQRYTFKGIDLEKIPE